MRSARNGDAPLRRDRKGARKAEQRRVASQQGRDHADVHNDQKDGEGLLEL